MQFTIVSEGTLRDEDLIPRFVDSLDYVKEEYSLDSSGNELEAQKKIGELDDFLAGLERRMEDTFYFEECYADRRKEDIETIHQWFDSLLPDGWFFGTIEGDGACFAIQQAIDEEA